MCLDTDEGKLIALGGAFIFLFFFAPWLIERMKPPPPPTVPYVAPIPTKVTPTPTKPTAIRRVAIIPGIHVHAEPTPDHPPH